MAPELLIGHTKSTPKIDVWSLGLMLHGMVFGFLPFTSNDRAALEKQIKTEQLDYKNLKKIKTSSIKNEVRRQLNMMLKNMSDELIDLIEQMLQKDPEKRIDNLGIFDHPWIRKYKKFTDDSDSDNLHSCKKDRVSSRTNSDFYGENHLETNFDSEPLGIEQKSLRNNSSQDSNLNSDLDQGKATNGTHKKSMIQKMHMFNIEEHDNETTGNFARVDLKPKSN